MCNNTYSSHTKLKKHYEVVETSILGMKNEFKVLVDTIL